MNAAPLAALLAAAAAFSAAAVPAPDAGTERTFAVRTARPERTAIADVLVKTGELAAPARVKLCAKVSGRLAETRLADGTEVSEGTRAARGDVLARIDAREWRVKRDAAAAAVAAAKAESESAAREFARLERLRETGAATQQEFDAALAARDRSAAALAGAECDLAAAGLDLSECEVRAPFDGVVESKSLHPGALVSPSGEIFGFVATDPLHALFDVPTTALPLLKPGETKVGVSVDAYPGETVPLVVEEVFPTADAATRTVRAKATLPNPSGKYVPGMFATGTFALGERDGVLVVPFEAVLRIEGRRCVYKVESGRAKLVDVETGLRRDEVVEIVSGLSDGDEIVVDGLHRLADGVPVRVVD